MKRPRLTLAALERMRSALSVAAALEVAEGRDTPAAIASWTDAAAWLDLEIERRRLRTAARKTRSALRRRAARARAAHADAWNPHL